MSELNTSDYYHRREAQERALADRAVSAAIATIHREMADRYAMLALQAEPVLRAPLRLVLA